MLAEMGLSDLDDVLDEDVQVSEQMPAGTGGRPDLATRLGKKARLHASRGRSMSFVPAPHHGHSADACRQSNALQNL
jgi:hypothetical protein